GGVQDLDRGGDLDRCLVAGTAERLVRGQQQRGTEASAALGGVGEGAPQQRVARGGGGSGQAAAPAEATSDLEVQAQPSGQRVEGAGRTSASWSSAATQRRSRTSAGFGAVSVSGRAVNTGHFSFSTMPEASTARYRKSGRTERMSRTSRPSSSRACREIASSKLSPRRGCPQKALVQTPGQVRLASERRVSSTAPSSRTRWQEKARWSGVCVEWTLARGASPDGVPSGSRRITWSSSVVTVARAAAVPITVPSEVSRPLST